MTLPLISKYPLQYDTGFELKTVVDSLWSKTTTVIVPYDIENENTYDWENGKGQIDLEDISNFPDNGYITVYLEGNYINAKNRAVLFHYNGKENNSLINVTILPDQKIKYFPVGSTVVQNIVAQNHNYNKNAILNLENYLGNRGTEDQSTIEWFADFYVKNIRVPKVWLNINNNIVFVGDYIIFKDLTTRIKPGFTPDLDSRVQWNFELGDGTNIKINLDIDSNEYVFDIRKINDNGGFDHYIERKQTWNREIRYRYINSGIFSPVLTVINEFGEDTLELKNFIKVIDNAPESLTLSVQGEHVDSQGNSHTRIKALEDQVTIRANLINNSNLVIAKYIWQIPLVDSDLIPESPYLNLSFDIGGIYDIGLQVITENDSWIGAFLDNAIDVVEKPSVWLGSVAQPSGRFTLNEYSIRANSWKVSSVPYHLRYTFENIQNIIDPNNILRLSFRNDHGFHHIINTDNAYLIWAKNQREINIAKYNSMTNSFQNELDNNFVKFYNWYTLYMPSFNSNYIYILGGLTDLIDLSKMSQQILYYDISAQVFVTVNQDFVLPSSNDTENIESFTTAFQNAQEMINNPNDFISLWKRTNYQGKGYILRNNENSLLQDMFSFDPFVNEFRIINTFIPFSKHELGFKALRDGLYVISNKGDIFRYQTDTNTWNTTTASSLSSFNEAFRDGSFESQNDNAKLVSGVESRTINSSNTNLYFSFDYSFDSYGKFDIETLSFQKLSSRPEYDSDQTITQQWDMTVF